MEKNNKQFRTSIGGQALIEGILMRGPEKQAIVVRSPEGLVTKVEELTLIKDKYPILGWPIIRGAVTFLDSMVRGVKALMFSADYYPEDENVQPSKLDKWLEEHVPAEKLQSVLVWVSVILSLGLTLLLFMLLPTFLVGLIRPIYDNYLVRNLCEGLVKIVIFTAYMIGISKLPDMRRIFSYHGAEHKTIKCYELGHPLAVENIRPCTRKHPRCGTSFLFVVIIISILAGSVIQVGNTLVRMLCHLLLLFPVVAISYEFNRLVGRHDNALTRLLTAPGMWFQNFTTNEPDDSMIECAIAAMEAVIPEQEGADDW